MCGMGIFKRIAPFFLALTVGILIAGIFVDVASPWGFRARRMQRMNEYRQMQCDFERLRSERDQLRSENEELKRQLNTGRVRFNRDDFIPPVPPPTMDVPPPPPIKFGTKSVR